jgi:hypothetical protein
MLQYYYGTSACMVGWGLLLVDSVEDVKPAPRPEFKELMCCCSFVAHEEPSHLIIYQPH